MAAHKQQAGKKRNVKYGGDDNDNTGAAAVGTPTVEPDGTPTDADAAVGTPTPTDAAAGTPTVEPDGTPTDADADADAGADAGAYEPDVEHTVFNPISQNAAATNGKTCVQKLNSIPSTDGKYVQVLNNQYTVFTIFNNNITDMNGTNIVPDNNATFYQVVPSATGGKRKSAKKPRKHAKKARKSAKKVRKSRGSRKSRK